MEIRLALNAVPLVASLAFLMSLRSDPGTLLFGDEAYPGELRLWGVLFRLFCLAAFFRFRLLWPVLVYVLLYALFGTTLGKALELATFSAFAVLLGGYRDVIIKNLTIERVKAPNTPNASLPWTPFSGLRRNGGLSNPASGGKRARSKSPAGSLRRRKPTGTPVAIALEESLLPEDARSSASSISPATSLPTSVHKTGSAIDELKRQKRKEQEARIASRARSSGKTKA